MTNSGDQMDLPADLNSISTLEYLGITPAVATDVHSRWLNIRSDPFFHDIELYQVTIDHIRLRGEYTDHYFGQNADWTIDLRSMGATEELIQGIMAEGHDAVRNSKTAREWFLDSIELRYQYLEDLQDDPEPKENPHIIGLDDTSHLSHVPGHTALYMGLSRTAAELLWKSNIEEHEKVQLVLQRLGTKPASDFSRDYQLATTSHQIGKSPTSTLGSSSVASSMAAYVSYVSTYPTQSWMMLRIEPTTPGRTQIRGGELYFGLVEAKI